MFWRNRRKRLGLLASYDVGALGTVLWHLRQRAELQLSLKITAAAVSVPHIIALYQDDVEDACTWAGFQYLTIWDYTRPLFWETVAAYTGYALGLRDDHGELEIRGQQLRADSERSVLSVHYAPNALTLALAIVVPPTYLWEPSYRHYENFSLGSDQERGDGQHDDFYWDTLRQAVESFLFEQVGAFLPAQTVMFLGDSAPKTKDEPFARLVLKILEQKQSVSPEIYFDGAAFAAARGTAELVKHIRRPAPNTTKAVYEYGQAWQKVLDSAMEHMDTGNRTADQNGREMDLR